MLLKEMLEYYRQKAIHLAQSETIVEDEEFSAEQIINKIIDSHLEALEQIKKYESYLVSFK